MSDNRLAKAATLSPETIPSTVIQILCQNSTNSQEAGKGKEEGLRVSEGQTKTTIYPLFL